MQIRNFLRCFLVALSCATLIAIAEAAESNSISSTQTNPVSTTNASRLDVAAWKHPAKKVFSNDGVTLKSFAVHGDTAQFEVAFPYDPQTSPNSRRVNRLCARLLQTGHWVSISMVSQDDRLQITAKRESNPKRITVDFAPLK